MNVECKIKLKIQKLEDALKSISEKILGISANFKSNTEKKVSNCKNWSFN
ncbi:hypothetical protein HYD64_03740 [Mycoplasmopsis bovis]|nr:hypothetical protein [Mycoplasmopsis bovis]QQH60258.1 hypothetical protein HYD64_03740 [Mycoplasmopsis bovis]